MRGPGARDDRRSSVHKRYSILASQAGASLIEQGQGGRYLYAVFPPSDGGPLPPFFFLEARATDDVEFLIPDDNDTRVEIRSASRLPDLSDGGRQARRLEEIRASLGWEEVGRSAPEGDSFVQAKSTKIEHQQHL